MYGAEIVTELCLKIVSEVKVHLKRVECRNIYVV